MAGIVNENGVAGRIGDMVGVVGDPFRGGSSRDTSAQDRFNNAAAPSQSSARSQDRPSSDRFSSSDWRDPNNDRSSDSSQNDFGSSGGGGSSSSSSFDSGNSFQSSFDPSTDTAEADRRAEEEQSAKFLAQGLDAHGFPIPTALDRSWDAMLVNVDTVDAAVKAVRAPPGSPLAAAIDRWNNMRPTQPDERVETHVLLIGGSQSFFFFFF